MHFLDIAIELNNNELRTTVYRKQAYEPILIPSWSRDPIRYKKSAFNYFFRRAILHSSDDEALRKEVNYIVSVGKKHGYSESFILGAYKNVRKKLKCVRNPQTDKDSNRQRPAEGYITVSSNLAKYGVIKKLATKTNRKVAPLRGQTIFNLLRNEKDPRSEKEKQGVYEIPVTNVRMQQPAKYIGVTTRTLAQRLQEHKSDIANARTTTVLALETYAEDLDVKWEEARIIKQIRNKKHAYTAETLEIFRRQQHENLLNDRTAVDLPAVWKYALQKKELLRHAKT